MSTRWTPHWSFETKNLRVVFETTYCEDNPADSFSLQEDVDAVNNGNVEWFDARVRVLTHDDNELGADYLGGCAYNSVREFFTSHRDKNPMNRNCSLMRAAYKAKTGTDKVSIVHYFPDMVQQAVNAARTTLNKLQSIPVRTA